MERCWYLFTFIWPKTSGGNIFSLMTHHYGKSSSRNTHHSSGFAPSSDIYPSFHHHGSLEKWPILLKERSLWQNPFPTSMIHGRNFWDTTKPNSPLQQTGGLPCCLMIETLLYYPHRIHGTGMFTYMYHKKSTKCMPVPWIDPSWVYMGKKS